VLDRVSHDVLNHCERHNIPFVPYFPLAAGMLRPRLDKSTLPPGIGPSDTDEATLDAIAANHDATREQVALAWLLQLSTIILTIPGTSSTAHLEANVAAAGLQLRPDEAARLTKLRAAGGDT
jgi:pyridoxine 4-dehydrogenase